jgi:hypothetical protein
MAKRWLLVAGILLLVSLMLIGCGVSTEDYERVLAERYSVQAELWSVKSELDSVRAELHSAKSELDRAKDDIEAQKALKALNLALSEELKKVKDPRHFESLEELEEWLSKDDTDKKYAEQLKDLSVARSKFATLRARYEGAFVLQVKALRDGYILRAIVTEHQGEIRASNEAFIGDYIYSVSPIRDSVVLLGRLKWPPSSHPLPLE